jgi:hypothetical protein
MSKTGERVGARSRDFGISVTLRGGSNDVRQARVLRRHVFFGGRFFGGRFVTLGDFFKNGLTPGKTLAATFCKLRLARDRLKSRTMLNFSHQELIFFGT